MMLIKKQYRPKLIKLLFPLAQLAFVAGILLGRLEISGFDFLIGALMGFSMVGNLAYLVNYRRTRLSSGKGDR